MKKIATGALAALTLAGALTATALPAAAADHHSYRGGGHYEGYRGYHGYRGGYYRGGGATAALIGLAASAPPSPAAATMPTRPPTMRRPAASRCAGTLTSAAMSA